MNSETIAQVARVNGVQLNTADAAPLTPEELRQRACTELLRQAAQAAGLLTGSDPPSSDGVLSEAATNAIEALLERSVQVRTRPTTSAGVTTRRTPALTKLAKRSGCVTFSLPSPRASMSAPCASGQRPRCSMSATTTTRIPIASVQRHVPCPTVPAVPQVATWMAGGARLRARVRPGDVWPCGGGRILPRLVHSRFGLHVVEVLERKPGVTQAFEVVQARVAQSLRQQTYVTALRQYLSVLAGDATLEGVDLEAAATPLLQ
jgi:peptidyl-prolyl cis-trans isomerase C